MCFIQIVDFKCFPNFKIHENYFRRSQFGKTANLYFFDKKGLLKVIDVV